MQKRLRRIAPPDVVRSLRTDLRRVPADRDRAARDPEERVLRRGREDLRRDRAHRVPADRPPGLHRDRGLPVRAVRDPEERVLRRVPADPHRDRAHRVPADRDLIPDGPSDKASSLYFSRRNCL